MADTAKTASQLPMSQHNEDRLRRADAWYQRSQEALPDSEERFVFLWIAFNAAYGSPLPGSQDSSSSERRAFNSFLRKIVAQDKRYELQSIILSQFAGPIRMLMANKYVFEPFWEWVRNAETSEVWRRKFNADRSAFRKRFAKGNVHGLLLVVFRRLYTLRNQIAHGGSTPRAGWGQDQVRDSARIMDALVPVILGIMRTVIENDRDTSVWGPVRYPRCETEMVRAH